MDNTTVLAPKTKKEATPVIKKATTRSKPLAKNVSAKTSLKTSAKAVAPKMAPIVESASNTASKTKSEVLKKVENTKASVKTAAKNTASQVASVLESASNTASKTKSEVLKKVENTKTSVKPSTISKVLKTGKSASKIVAAAASTMLDSSIKSTKAIAGIYAKAGKKALTLGKEIYSETAKVVVENQKTMKKTSAKAFKETLEVVQESHLIEYPFSKKS